MIGVFDSGFGGLTVLKSLVESFPNNDFIYLGDNARAPYGSRSKDVILQYTREAVDFLTTQGATNVVIACNSAVSISFESIVNEYEKKGIHIFNIIDILAKKAYDNSYSKRIAVVGTKTTIREGLYRKALTKLDKDVKIYEKAMPLIVSFIEEGWHKSLEAKMVLKKYLRYIKSCNVDTLILGCTHYPIMMKEFKQIMGKRVKIISLGENMTEEVGKYVDNKKEKGSVRYITSGDVEDFKVFAEKIIGRKISKVEKWGTITPTQ